MSNDSPEGCGALLLSIGIPLLLGLGIIAIANASDAAFGGDAYTITLVVILAVLLFVIIRVAKFFKKDKDDS